MFQDVFTDLLFNPLVMIIFFWIIAFAIGSLFHLEKYGLKIAPLFLFFQTKKANKTISKIARKHPRGWVALWSFGVAMSFVIIVFVMYFLLNNLLGLLFRTEGASPLVPIIPGITITGMTIVYFIFPFFISIIVHEFSHGIAAQAEGIPVKSAGFFIAFLFPGAFVEPDENKLKESSDKTKLRIYAAGAFSNMGLAIIALLLLNMTIFSAVISPLYGPSQGLIFQETVEGGPASNYVTPPFVLTAVSINGSSEVIPINSISDFIEVMSLTDPNTNLTIYTDQGVFIVPLAENPNVPGGGFLGVILTTAFPYFPPKPWAEWVGPIFPYHLYQMINWLWIISFSLTIFNLLPIPFFDGDKITSVILNRYVPDKHKIKLGKKEIRVNRIILNSLRVFSISLLALNIILSFIIFPILF
ncbi:MAG: site-2 protease family protein [Candidatus Odinarchaeia archaeon]